MNYGNVVFIVAMGITMSAGMAKEQMAKLQKQTKYHLYITEKQHKRHMKEREYQHKKHLTNLEKIHRLLEQIVSNFLVQI
jgi:hypothetical protein